MDKLKFLKKSFDEANESSQNFARVRQILRDARDRLKLHPKQFREFIEEVEVLMDMIQTWAKGKYKKVPVQTIVMGLAALIYFINPFDFIHDYLPGIGFVDDAALLGFVIRSIKAELDEYKIWKKHSD